MPSTPRRAEPRISRQVVDRPGDQLEARVVAGARQARGDHRVGRPRSSARPAPAPGGGRCPAGACAARRARRSPAASPTGSSSSRGSPWAGSSPARSPGASSRSARRLETSMVEIDGALDQAPLAKRGHHLVLAPGDLQVAVDLDPVERRPGERVEHLVEGQRLAAGGVAPVVGDQQRAAPARPPGRRPRGASRRRRGSPRAGAARRARSSRRPASTAASKLSRVFPGRIESAPLWPIRFKRRTVVTLGGGPPTRKLPRTSASAVVGASTLVSWEG